MTGVQTCALPIYVDDLVEGIFRLMKSKINDPVNLGNPVEFTILKLAKIIIKLTNSRSKIIFKSLPQDDPKVRCPDIAKARKLLKWMPAVKLEEGLEQAINYFRRYGK